VRRAARRAGRAAAVSAVAPALGAERGRAGPARLGARAVARLRAAVPRRGRSHADPRPRARRDPRPQPRRVGGLRRPARGVPRPVARHGAEQHGRPADPRPRRRRHGAAAGLRDRAPCERAEGPAARQRFADHLLRQPGRAVRLPRRVGAQGDGAAVDAAGVLRPADRARQPGALPRTRGARGRAPEARPAAGHRDVSGPGQLQERQRQPGPRRGRRIAGAGREARFAVRPDDRLGGPAGRRRVRDPDRADGAHRGRDPRRGADQGGTDAAVHAGRRGRLRGHQHRHREHARRRNGRGTAAQRGRRDVHRQRRRAGGATRSTTRRSAATWWSG